MNFMHESAGGTLGKGPELGSAISLAAPDFEPRVSRVLSLLSMTSLRLSVFAISSPGLDGFQLCGVLRETLGRSCEVARLDRDTVGVLYYGPRPAGLNADQRVVGDLLSRLDGSVVGRARGALSLRALHVSSTNIVDAGDLIANLRRMPLQVGLQSARSLAA